jgi:hypothetical protein
LNEELHPMATIVGGRLLHDWHTAPTPEWTAV